MVIRASRVVTDKLTDLFSKSSWDIYHFESTLKIHPLVSTYLFVKPPWLKHFKIIIHANISIKKIGEIVYAYCPKVATSWQWIQEHRFYILKGQTSLFPTNFNEQKKKDQIAVELSEMVSQWHILILACDMFLLLPIHNVLFVVCKEHILMNYVLPSCSCIILTIREIL